MFDPELLETGPAGRGSVAGDAPRGLDAGARTFRLRRTKDAGRGVGLGAGQECAGVKMQGVSQETEWMLAVRDRRDRVAFARLFDHFAPRLKGMLCRTGMSQSEAEDIAQDVLLTVWRKAALFDPTRAGASAWIYQIARNRQVDVVRRERRPLPEELRPLDHETPEDAAQILALEQETQALRVALGRLGPAQREMVERAYLGELSHSEISQQTGLPLGTIKSRIRLGLEKLRHELKGVKSR